MAMHCQAQAVYGLRFDRDNIMINHVIIIIIVIASASDAGKRADSRALPIVVDEAVGCQLVPVPLLPGCCNVADSAAYCPTQPDPRHVSVSQHIL
eukprot:2243204-Rhodomonas_salina.1